jgi:plastocyanin
MRNAWMVVLTTMSLMAIGCGDDDGETPETDSGTPGVDSGTPGVDSGTPEVDSGTPEVDSGTPEVDSGTPEVDSGTPATGCPAGYADCDTFMDMTGSGTVTISPTGGFTYDPKCIRVTTGQMVTFEGSGAHPTMGACGPGDMNPITDMSTTSQTLSFATPGVYGFHCMRHGAASGTGMAGAIEVVAE